MKNIFTFLILMLACCISFGQGYTIEIGEDDKVEIKENTDLRVTGEIVREFSARGDHDAARSMAKQCAERYEDYLCKYYHGMYLFMDNEASAEDEQLGLSLIESASEKKISSADVLLGIFYENGQELKNGKHIKADINKAMKLWTRAANNCNAWAQNMLAQKYYFGLGVEVDLKEAFYWISIAAQWDFPNSKQGVSVIGEELDDEDRLEIERKSSKFYKDSGCGLTPDKPVLMESWGMEG